MAKKKKRNRGKSLSPQRYEALLLRLIEAWEMADENADVFWDYGPGERPQMIEQQLNTVARKEAIPVTIQRGRDSLKLIFKAKPKQQGFRVVSKDGDLKLEGKMRPAPDTSTL